MKAVALVMVLAAAGTVSATEPIEAISIPLETVWAHDMPGTRDIHELQKEFDKRYPPMGNEQESLLAIVARGIERRRGSPVGEAMAVQGSGLDALVNVFRVFTKQVDKSRGAKGLAGDDGVSLFFFTAYSPRYVHLKEITRSGSNVAVKYDLIPHLTKDLSMHLALVPLGDLPAGQYRVEVSAKPLTEDAVGAGFTDVDDQWKDRHVSSSFAFRVN
ncbi:MAG: hypothetical protein ACRCT8_17285 [Lacipirellulaceae bacterium]